MSGEEAAEDLIFDGLKLNRRGLLRLDPAGRAVPVALGSRALDLLLLLAKHQGAVVSKGDLMAGAWPGTTVEASNLTKQISALRRALDENPGIGSCIQTVPSRGYRFVATVTRTHQPTAAAPLPAVRERPSCRTAARYFKRLPRTGRKRVLWTPGRGHPRSRRLTAGG